MKNNTNINYIWRLLVHIQRLRAASNQGGYAMLMTSVLAILTFSMLSVYLFSTNLYRSVANANVDAGTTFYAAESALNNRANITRAKFESFQVPTGSSPSGSTIGEQMRNCIRQVAGAMGSGELGCAAPVEYTYREPVVEFSGGTMKESMKTNGNVTYRTYTFLKDITNYTNLADRTVQVTTIPAGEPFAGLNMLDYRYRVYASAAKEVTNGLQAPSGKDNAAQTMLQMEFSNRQVPLFQFAAFYQNDLEVTSSTDMTITGPVHTNSSLRLAPGGNLTFANKVTSVLDMYKSLEYVASHFAPSQLITLANGTTISTSGAWNNSNILMTNNEINSSGGQLLSKVPTLEVPDAGKLGTDGEYYLKSDVSVDFTPKISTQPFTVKAMGNNLSGNELLSLRQPVLAVPVVRGGSKTGEQTMLCPQMPTAPTIVLDSTQQSATRRALQRAMFTLAQGNLSSPVSYTSVLNTPSSTMINTLRTALQTEGITNTTLRNNIAALRWRQVADLSGDCWLPAPMKITTQLDRRELRNITVLQSDIESLAVWNRDGKTLEGTTLTDISNKLYNAKPAPTPVASDYTMEEMGMGADDNTQGGLVWHFSIDKGNNTKVDTYPNKQSIYGFAFVGGKYLPGPLSLVTDQAAYVQGDFNDARNYNATNSMATVPPSMTTRQLAHKKPAAVMADTIAVLSNACLDTNRTINCLNLNGTAVPLATSTGINAAFLTRTDKTVVTNGTRTRDSGGLNNYIRTVENWMTNSQVLSYWGSMISLGEPKEFSGPFLPGSLTNGNPGANTNQPTNANYYYFLPPIRNFNFDSSFNSVAGLPPMTPRAIYLKQKVFKRDYNTSDRDISAPTNGMY